MLVFCIESRFHNNLLNKASLRDWVSLMDCQRGQSQKEGGQEEQGEVKELGEDPLPLDVFRSAGPPGLPSGSALPGNTSRGLIMPLRAL